MLVTAGAVPFALSWTYASSVALAVDHYGLYAVPQAAQSSIGLIASPILAALFGESGAIVGLTASHVLAAAGTFLWTAGVLRSGGSAGPGLGQLSRAIRFGLKTHLSNVLSFVNYRLDLFILNGVASGAKVGQYSIAVSVTSAVWLLPRALSTVVVPRLARLSVGGARGDAAYQDMVETKSVRHTTLVVAVTSVGLAGFLIALVLLFYGPEFRPSIVLGLILLPGTALVGIAGTVAAIVVGRDHPAYTLRGALLTTPPTILLYLLIVPRLDAVGAALASTVSYAVGFFVGAYFFRLATGRRVWPIVLPTRDELMDYRRLIEGFRARRNVAKPG